MDIVITLGIVIALCIIFMFLGMIIYRQGIKDGMKRQNVIEYRDSGTLDALFEIPKRERHRMTDDEALFESAMNYSGAKPLRDLKQGD